MKRHPILQKKIRMNYIQLHAAIYSYNDKHTATSNNKSVTRETLEAAEPIEPDGTMALYHADYMREWRKTHPLTPEQQIKDRARSYANVYKHRGRIRQEPCAVCGLPDSEMHHPDYSKPLEVEWLCRPCHLKRHR